MLRSCLYISTLVLPCNPLTSAEPAVEITPITLTRFPSLILILLLTFSAYKRSQISRQTCLHQSEPIAMNFDSSRKWSCDPSYPVLTKCIFCFTWVKRLQWWDTFRQPNSIIRNPPETVACDAFQLGTSPNSLKIEAAVFKRCFILSTSYAPSCDVLSSSLYMIHRS